MKSESRLKRRGWLQAAAASGIYQFDATSSFALGRIPLGGSLQLSLPWKLQKVDPHDGGDLTAGLLGEALFDPIFSTTKGGQVYAALAHSLPTQSGTDCVVQLRSGLSFADGQSVSSRDLLWSIRRAQEAFGAALLSRLPPPVRESSNSVRFRRCRAGDVAKALSDPHSALVPRGFKPTEPSGTGAFRAVIDSEHVHLQRNPLAARGAAFLERVVIRSRPSVAAALRDFEVGQSDIGWLGRGLRRPRPGSRLVHARRLGWVVLHGGSAIGRWSAPGTVQQLLSLIAPDQLRRFGIRSIGSSSVGSSSVGSSSVQGGNATKNRSGLVYAGPSCELIAPADSAYLVELGQALTALLSRASGKIEFRAIERAHLRRLKRNRRFAFLLDLVRDSERDHLTTQLALTREADPALVRRAVAIGADNRQDLVARLTQTLSLGVVGELKLQFGATDDFGSTDPSDLASVWKR